MKKCNYLKISPGQTEMEKQNSGSAYFGHGFDDNDIFFFQIAQSLSENSFSQLDIDGLRLI